MPSVCLTGRAEDVLGQFIERRDLIRELGRRGWGYHDAVYTYTDYLVASRTDTRKARAAAANGTAVITYSELWRLLEGRRSAPPPPRPAPEPVAAHPPADPSIPFGRTGTRRINI